MQNNERRARFRKDLHPLYLPIYDGLCSVLGPEWQPYFGYRGFGLQDHIYAQGRSIPGPIVTQAKGGESAHNYGCASDWTLWTPEGEPLWLPPEYSRWKELGNAAEKVHGDWGGLFAHPDCPHVQLGLTIPWKQVRQVFIDEGQEAAMKLIEKRRI